MIDDYTDDYTDGFMTGCRAHLATPEPSEPPLGLFAPDWAVNEASSRAYAWLKGFYIAWNYLAGKRGWPDWTHARMIFKRINEPRREEGDHGPA